MTDRHSVVPAVWMLVFNSKDELLLIRRANTGWRDGWYTVPSGHIEKGESPSTSAIRELEEEVGISISPKSLEMTHTAAYVADSKDHERVSFFFKVTDAIENASNAEPHKADDLIWRRLDELPENIVPILRYALTQISNGVHYSELNYPESKVTL